MCTREAKPRGEVTCSGACSVCEAAEEEAESQPGAGKGKKELPGSITASAAAPGQGDSLLLVSPAARGCLNNGEVGCAPPSCGTCVISDTTLGAHAIPAPLRGQRVHSEMLFCKESASFCF